jgi:hypothetical protein
VSSSRSASSQRCVRGICIACACNVLPLRPSVGVAARPVAVCRFLDVFFMSALYTTGNPHGQIAAIDGRGTQRA